MVISLFHLINILKHQEHIKQVESQIVALKMRNLMTPFPIPPYGIYYPHVRLHRIPLYAVLHSKRSVLDIERAHMNKITIQTIFKSLLHHLFRIIN